jgi:NADH:ubiquinone oxidoreductase subunit K
MNIIGTIPINIFIFFHSVIILIGFVGLFVNRQNLIRGIICLEIMYLGVNLNFIYASFYLDDITGSIFSMVLTGIAGCEISMGIALGLVLFRHYSNTTIEVLKKTKG